VINSDVFVHIVNFIYRTGLLITAPVKNVANFKYLG
jgi:hypothetical protein